MAKLKIGVFGAGRGMSMVEQLLHNEDAEFVAVCDKYKPLLDNCRKEAEAAGLYNVAYYEKFDDFFNHDMDAVVMANYAHEHAHFAIPLLKSGRHVMSEVLTCANLAEAIELIETVEQTGKVYCYAENYCYTAARWEMRKRYKRGDIGELMYGEGEYIHDCSSIWPEITYGERDHWRNRMYSTFYCTHSLGPVLFATGLRPTSVVGFETQSMPFMRNLGYAGGCAGLEMVTLENGAIVKSLHCYIKHTTHSNYQLNGDRGAMQDVAGLLRVYTEGENENCRGKHDEYTPEFVIKDAAGTGHGGGDFFTTHYFIKSILGDEEAKKNTINVYDGVDMCIPGILSYRSILNGNAPQKVPNFRNVSERDAYRNDRFCTFKEAAGDQWVSNNVKHPDTEIPDSVYKEVERRWKAGEPG